MKNRIKTTLLLIAFSITGTIVFAQTPPPGAVPPPSPVPDGIAPPGPPMANVQARRGRNERMPRRGLTVLTSVSGNVVAYIANDQNVYNAFTLQTANQTMTVRFPDHLGAQLMRDAKKGESITVNGFIDTDPQGMNVFHLVSAKAGGNQIIDTPPALPVVTDAPELKNYDGTISDFRKDMQGNINGVILNSKEIIELPPHVSAQLQGMIKTGEKILVTGFKMVPPAGVVMARENSVINPQTITLNGQTYLVR